MKISQDFNWNTRENKQLVEAVLLLETVDEVKRFLRDLMTEDEIKEFAKRFEAARMLSEQTSYTSIIEKTGLSSTTVARISKWLKGSLGGYRLVIDRMNHHRLSAQAGKGLSS